MRYIFIEFLAWLGVGAFFLCPPHPHANFEAGAAGIAVALAVLCIFDAMHLIKSEKEEQKNGN